MQKHLCIFCISYTFKLTEALCSQTSSVASFAYLIFRFKGKLCLDKTQGFFMTLTYLRSLFAQKVFDCRSLGFRGKFKYRKGI